MRESRVELFDASGFPNCHVSIVLQFEREGGAAFALQPQPVAAFVPARAPSPARPPALPARRV